MKYEITEIDGKLWRVFPKGNKLRYITPNPLLVGIPNSPGVYSLTQISTGKRYIGSSNDLKARVSGYVRDKRPNSLTVNIPLTDIVFEALEVTETANKEILRTRELHWILTLKSYAPHGYNLRSPVNGIAIKERAEIDYLTRITPKIKKPRTKQSFLIPLEKTVILKQKPGFADLLLMFKDDRY